MTGFATVTIWDIMRVGAADMNEKVSFPVGSQAC